MSVLSRFAGFAPVAWHKVLSSPWRRQRNYRHRHAAALPNQAPVVSARADHGTVSVKPGKGPGCGRPSMSPAEVF